MTALRTASSRAEGPDADRPRAWDEAYEPDGRPRAAYVELLAALAEVDLGGLASAVDRRLAGHDVTFGDGGRFIVDPVPRVFTAAEWDLIERGVAQRTRALAAFVEDVYGPREIVEAGVVPARAIDTAAGLEPLMAGLALDRARYVAGLDLVRGRDGALRVLEDNLRAPSGIAYAIAAREAIDAELPFSPPARRRDSASWFDLLGAALREAAPEGAGEPVVALLSDGPRNSAWYEHRALAAGLGVPLVRPADLEVIGERLRMVGAMGTRRGVDVLYRRTDEDRLSGPGGRLTQLGELLLGPLRAGTVAVVNPFGAGVADDKLLHSYVEDMGRFYLAQEPLLPSVRSYDLGDPRVLAEQLPRLNELVLKPRGGYGGRGVTICPHADPAVRDAAIGEVRAAPGEWVAQELVELSTHPTVCGDRLVARHVDLRPFAVGGRGGAAVAPGGLTRVALGAGDLVVNSSQDGGGKDTWVLER